MIYQELKARARAAGNARCRSLRGAEACRQGYDADDNSKRSQPLFLFLSLRRSLFLIGFIILEGCTRL